MDVQLVEISREYADQIWDYRQECYSEDGIPGAYGLTQARSGLEFIENTLKFKDAHYARSLGFVPANSYILLRQSDQKMLGIINIRHELNDYLRTSGGHIGYSIHLSERRKGYAKKMLQLGLDKCRELGLDKVLITCVSSNIASQRTIIANGGNFEREIEGTQLYWITLAKTLKTGETVIIRKAQEDDAEKMLEYLNAVGGESDNLLFGENEFGLTVEEEKAFIQSVADSKTSGLFIALLDDEIISIGSLLSAKRPRIAHRAEIGISVRKAYWRTGAATLMLEHLIDFARQSGQIKIIELNVRSDNEAAIGLYKKMGFEKIGYFPKGTKIGDAYFDLELMNLYL